MGAARPREMMWGRERLLMRLGAVFAAIMVLIISLDSGRIPEGSSQGWEMGGFLTAAYLATFAWKPTRDSLGWAMAVLSAWSLVRGLAYVPLGPGPLATYLLLNALMLGLYRCARDHLPPPVQPH